jgi:catechol 2,3-dioxygenase-like lactoylglutathione lyase family enzyme
MFYTSKAEELRAFIRDKLRFSFSDVGQGWLIFDLPEAEMGVHPADAAHGAPSGMHNISFYCDDIHKTVAELKGRGVEFLDDVKDAGFGLITHFKMPGDVKVELYQPKYTKHHSATV